MHVYNLLAYPVAIRLRVDVPYTYRAWNGVLKCTDDILGLLLGNLRLHALSHFVRLNAYVHLSTNGNRS